MSNKSPSRFTQAIQAALGVYGYKRVTAAEAVTVRTFETSEINDVPIGSKMYDRTLPAHKAQKLNQHCWEAYKKNPIIWGMVELVVRATVGQESRIVHNKLESEIPAEKAAAEKMQPILERWWNSRYNNWPKLAEQIQHEKILFGELVPVYMTNQFTGDVEIGFIDVNCIREIMRSKVNTRRITGIKVSLDTGTERIFHPIEIYDGRPLFDEQQQYPDWFRTWEKVNSSTLIDRRIGEVSYWADNTTLSGMRGQGDFAQVIDSANDAVGVVRGITDRVHLNNKVYAKFTFPETWDQTQINAALSDPTSPNYINPPRIDDDTEQVMAFGVTKNIDFQFVSPNVGASESSEVFKMALSLFSSGSSIPLHWLGWTEELAYASSKETGNLPLKYLEDRQKTLKRCLREATDFQLDQWRIFSHELDGIQDELIYDYDFIMPPIESAALERIIQVVKGEVDVLLAAKTAGVIDDEQTKRKVGQSLKRLGMDSK